MLVKHARKGDVGELFERGGDKFVRVQKPRGEKVVRHNPDLWQPLELEPRELMPGQKAEIAFKADQAVCKVLGLFSEKKEYDRLIPAERLKWADPKKPPMEGRERRRIYMFLHRGMEASRKERGGGKD